MSDQTTITDFTPYDFKGVITTEPAIVIKGVEVRPMRLTAEFTRGTHEKPTHLDEKACYDIAQRVKEEPRTSDDANIFLHVTDAGVILQHAKLEAGLSLDAPRMDQ